MAGSKPAMMHSRISKLLIPSDPAVPSNTFDSPSQSLKQSPVVQGSGSSYLTRFAEDELSSPTCRSEAPSANWSHHIGSAAGVLALEMAEAPRRRLRFAATPRRFDFVA